MLKSREPLSNERKKKDRICINWYENSSTGTPRFLDCCKHYKNQRRHAPILACSSTGASFTNSTLAVWYPSVSRLLSTRNRWPPTVSKTDRPSGRCWTSRMSSMQPYSAKSLLNSGMIISIRWEYIQIYVKYDKNAWSRVIRGGGHSSVTWRFSFGNLMPSSLRSTNLSWFV